MDRPKSVVLNSSNDYSDSTGSNSFGTLTAGDSVVPAVPEDASLDQFASSEATETDSGEAETEDPDSEEAATDEADPEEGEVRTEESEVQTGDADPENGEANSEDAEADPEDASPVEPAVSTYQWSAEGGECADCGASADRLWRGEGQKDGGLVCPECKDW